jgi:acetamidase/formamidase
MPASAPASGVRTIHHEHQHLSWDNAREPAIRIAPGTTVEFRDIDATCGQITAESTVETIRTLDFARINPIAGPVHVEGAVPGDAVKVTLRSFDPSGWAWTAIVPDFGLLSDDFPQPALHIWKYDTSFATPSMFGKWAKVPLKPFCGTIGLASAAIGPQSTIPPYACGGNMDIRDLTVGVEIYLPVEVPGALFSIGDPHASQGDGEVCGTAIESPMSVTATIDLVKGEKLRFPRFVSHVPVTRHLDSKGYDATTGINPDLMSAARDAVRGMIDLLCKRHHMNPPDAYMLCSVCGDLRISEIVDRPNWVVSFYMPRQVFD